MKRARTQLIAKCALVVLFLGPSLLASQDALQRPKIFGIAHIALDESDLQRACVFYRDYLGFEQPFSLKKPDGADWIAYVKIGDQQYFELFASRPADVGHFNHLAFYTDDVNAMQEYLSSRRIELIEQVRTTRTGDALLSFRDPAGNLVEIMQYQSGSWTDGARGKFLPPTRVSDHLSHIGFVVRNSGPVIRFYRDILGFRQLERTAVSGESGAIRLRVPDGADYIEILAVAGHTQPRAIQPEDYIGLLSADLRKSASDLRRRSQERSYQSQEGANCRPTRTCLKDPDGIRIEITERKVSQASTSP